MSLIVRLLRNSPLSALALILLSLAVMLPGLGQGVVTRESELRVLLCARKMADGGSWLVPNYLGHERLRKPPLMYWLVGGAFKLRGSTSDVAAARAVAAAAATGLVLAVYFGGRRLIGRRGAFFAAIVLASSIGFVRHARLAETDMAQALFTALAIFSAYAALTTDRPVRWWIACGVSAGTGFMFKGPGSLAMPVAATAVFVLCERFGASGRNRLRAALAATPRLRLRMSWIGLISALVLFAAIVAPWYVAVALRTTDNTAYQATDEISRLLVESHHPGPFFYYLYTLPFRLGFWGLLIPVAVWAAFRRARHHRGMQMLLAWFTSSFVILSALQSKQQHYALILIPPAALLCGWLLARASRLPVIGKTAPVNFQKLETAASAPRRDLPATFARSYVRWLCAALAFGGIAIVASKLFPIPAQHVALRDAAVPAAAACGLFALAGFIFCRRRVLCGLIAITAVYAVLVAVQVTRLERIENELTIIREFTDEHRTAIRDAGALHIGGPRASVIVWYAGRDANIVIPDNISSAWQGAKPGDAFIASDKTGRPRLAPLISTPPNDVAEREDVHLSLYIKPGQTP